MSAGAGDDLNTKTLSGVMQKHVHLGTRGIRVALPARVESYDAATHTCSAQPLIMDGRIDASGERVVERLPVVTDVPVCFPGSGGARFKFPVSVGDTVLLVFASSSLDLWLAQGGEVDPGDDRRHHLSDAIAITGIQDRAHAGDATPMIEITTTEIHAGGSNPLVLRSEFLAHTHATAATGTPSPPVPGPSGSAGSFPGTTVLKGA